MFVRLFVRSFLIHRAHRSFACLPAHPRASHSLTLFLSFSLPPFFTAQSNISRYFLELSDNIRILDELDNSVNQANEFGLVLSETGKLLRNQGMGFVWQSGRRSVSVRVCG